MFEKGQKLFVQTGTQAATLFSSGTAIGFYGEFDSEDGNKLIIKNAAASAETYFDDTVVDGKVVQAKNASVQKSNLIPVLVLNNWIAATPNARHYPNVTDYTPEESKARAEALRNANNQKYGLGSLDALLPKA